MSWVLQNAVLVDAGLMGKSIGADNGLVRLNNNAGNHRHKPAGRIDFLSIDGRTEMHHIHPGIEGHNYLLKGSISRPLTNAVYGDFRLPRPRPDSSKGICCSQSQIVVAMDAHNRFMDIGCVGPHIRNQFEKLLWDRVSHCIGQILW